jgi:two-component system nitrate/nitrite response regulator NarL
VRRTDACLSAIGTLRLPMVSGNVSDSPTRLVLVADIRLYRDGLAATLPRERLMVVGTASNRAEASAIVHALNPEVVIVDISMPEAFDLMREVRSDLPTAQLIALAVAEDINAIIECAQAGATAYVSVHAGMDDLVRTIEGAAGGELQCSPRIAAELFRRIGDESRVQSLKTSDPTTLSTRERQVLTHLRQSLSNKEIAAHLNISEATVKNHVHHLLEKLQVTSRRKAAACLIRPRRPALRTG